MSKVILDQTLREKLNGLTEQLEVCNEAGQTVGRFLPEQEYRKLLYAAVEAACPYTKEELERSRREPGGRSLAEILKSLEQC
jgi:hypothetical protein